jgi:hypothetical protein
MNVEWINEIPNSIGLVLCVKIPLLSSEHCHKQAPPKPTIGNIPSTRWSIFGHKVNSLVHWGNDVRVFRKGVWSVNSPRFAVPQLSIRNKSFQNSKHTSSEWNHHAEFIRQEQRYRSRTSDRRHVRGRRRTGDSKAKNGFKKAEEHSNEESRQWYLTKESLIKPEDPSQNEKPNNHWEINKLKSIDHLE